MSAATSVWVALSWSAAGLGLIVSAYAAFVGVAWTRYGHVRRATGSENRDHLLDQFMPVYEAGGRHKIRISAPAAVTLAAAREMDLLGLPLVRAIIRGREILLGSTPDDPPQPGGLLKAMQALGWGVLAEVPGREVVMGAVTQPWKANVVFQALPPDEFASFQEPGYVKIAWTLRTDPLDAGGSVFRTDTRAVATDPVARAKFRWYWSLFSPGMMLIRWAALAPLKREAERRAGSVCGGRGLRSPGGSAPP